MLQRSDLPEDPHHFVSAVDTARWDTSPDDLFEARGGRRGRLATVLSVLAGVLVALAVAVAVWVGTAAVGHNASATAAVIVGVPALLLVASLLASIAGRRRASG